MSLFSFLRKNKQDSVSSESVGASDTSPERPRRRKSGQGREAIDPMLPEKKRARRRLIGAIALVMTAVVVLPMVLDSEQKPLADDIAIQIPSKDKSHQAKPAPQSDKESEPTKPGAAPSTPESNTGALPATAGLDPKEELIEPPPSTRTDKPVAPPTQAAASGAVKPRDQQTAALTERTAESVKPAAPRSESAKAEPAKPDTKSETKVEARKPESAKAEAPKKPAQQEKQHAAELAAKEEKAAHKAQQEKIERAERAERAEKAEKIEEAARVRALLEGKSDPKAALEKSEKDKAASKYLIQVAALSSQEKVVELQNKLRDAGIKSYAQKVATESGDRIRIRVGPFTSKEEADRMRARIGKLGLGGTVVPS